MSAYYNEIDPQAAQWLRNLIAAGHIAPGEVDERSIRDVAPSDLVGFTQCHFFAGVGVWSHALRGAGWPDDRPVWTGSCPCQPFSDAGKGGGFEDDRHLWPDWFRLIRERRPDELFGEQVASKVALSWLDHVCTDLEGEGYAVGTLDMCAAGVGAPHIRQRLFFVADSSSSRVRDSRRGEDAGPSSGGEGEGDQRKRFRNDLGDGDSRLGDAERAGLEGLSGHGDHGHEPGRLDALEAGSIAAARIAGGVADNDEGGCEVEREARLHADGQPGDDAPRRGPVNGFWRGAEWIPCRDGKARPVEPGSFPLAHGAPARLVRLRAYGNAIVAPVAQEFVGAYMSLRRLQMRDRNEQN